MKTIKEKVWKRAITELDYEDTERNFKYEEPIIDLTLAEVMKVIDETIGYDIYYDPINENMEHDEDKDSDWIDKEELKQNLGGGK